MASSLQLVPSDGADAAATFRQLGINFSIAEAVTDALVKARLQNLEEFRFFFESEDKVQPWLAKLSLGEDAGLQGARVHRAWAAVSLYFKQSEQDRSRISASDLDALLGDSELRDLKSAFWRRYKLRFPPEVHPADATISRVTRELTKRMLCVYNIWRVKSLQFQQATTQRKRKIADSLYVEEAEEDEPANRDANSYLDKLWTLLLAYAMAGSASCTTAPGVAESLGSNSVEYVEVPVDVIQQYFYRAKRSASLIPYNHRLEWLQQRDNDERSEWVSRFRDSQKSLGRVIQEVYAMRDAHWSVPVTTSGIPSSRSTPEPVTPVKPDSNRWTLGNPINGRQVAKILKDGTRLCQAFQHGQCKAKANCANGQHRCGLVLRKERACGAPGHGAAACRGGKK